MTSTYTSGLRIDKQGTGDNNATWGAITNTNFDLIDAAISGVTAITTTGGATTLTAVNGASDQARNAILSITGALTSNATINAPASVTKLYAVRNATSGAYTVTIGVTGGTGVTIPQGFWGWVYCDGTNATAILKTGNVAGALLTLDGNGSIVSAPGTISAPGLAVAGDADTGLAQLAGANTLSMVVGGVEALRATLTPSAANLLTVSGAVAGDSPYLIPIGTDANIGLNLKTKGTGPLLIRGGDHALQVAVATVASATRYITMGGSAGGDPTFGASAGAVQFSSAVKAKQASIAYTSSLTLDFASYQDFVIGDLTGPLTIANPSAYPIGQRGEILTHEDATGGWTISLGSNWVKMGNGTVNTTAGKYSIIVYWIAVAGLVHYSIVGGA